ncbi:MAG: DNA-binding protein [Bacteroidetes bacterium]|nr:DNA-binding protein [Bacteroidota bacterium]
MIITFEELRRVKDSLPSGSMQRIATELDLNDETVRNFFGGTKYEEGGSTGVHFEKGGANGGLVKMDETEIWDAALRILEETESVS